MINRVLVSAFALLAAAIPATAATYTTTFGAPDPGPGLGETIPVNFDDPLPGGYSLTGHYGYATGTHTGMGAPAGDDTQYLYTSPTISDGVATLSTLDLSTVSFYWGSIDDYNKVELLGTGGTTLLTVKGSDLSPANGNQGTPHTNQRIYFTAGAGETITSLRFTATGIAYEIDDVAGTLKDSGNPSTVPEPATWGLMIVGFGMVGVGARRRRSVARHVSA